MTTMKDRISFKAFVNRAGYVTNIFLMILVVLVSFFQPLIWGDFIQRISQHEFEKLTSIIVLIVVIRIISIIAHNAFTYNTVRLKKNMEYSMKCAMMKNELNLKYETIQSLNAGQFVSRFHSDVVVITNFIIETILQIVQNIALIILVSTFIGHENLAALASVLIFSVVSTLNNYFLGEKYRTHYISFRKIADNYFSMMYQTLNGMFEIKAQGLKEDVYQENEEILNNIRINEIDLFGLKVKADLLGNICEGVSFVLVLLISINTYVNGTMELQSFIALFSYLPTVSSSMINLSKIFTNSKEYFVAKDRIKYLVHPKSYEVEVFGDKQFPKQFQNISLENVCYRYPASSDLVLDHVNIEFVNHSRVAVVGESGSGKSTLINLLLKIYSPTEGRILVDDLDLSNFTEESIRNSITVVSQNPYFLNESLIKNLRRGYVNDIAIEEIVEMLDKVGLQKYSGGLNYVMSESNTNLSGGEKQRFGIIRSLLKSAGIILFDEPTSSQDNESIECVLQMIDEYSRDKLIIMISHRMKNITKYDDILVLKNGKLIDHGTHDYLIRNCSYYRELCMKEGLNTEIRNK